MAKVTIKWEKGDYFGLMRSNLPIGLVLEKKDENTTVLLITRITDDGPVTQRCTNVPDDMLPSSRSILLERLSARSCIAITPVLDTLETAFEIPNDTESSESSKK